MIERVTLQMSKETGRREIIKTERLSPEEEAERLREAHEKAEWTAWAWYRAAYRKGVKELTMDLTMRLIYMQMTNEQIMKITDSALSISEIESLRAEAK